MLRKWLVLEVLAMACSKNEDTTVQVAAPSAPAVASEVPSTAPVVASAAPAAPPSLCQNLDQWTKPLVDAGQDIGEMLPRFKTRNQAAKSPLELIKVGGEFARDAQAKGEALRTKGATLKQQAVAEDEEPVHADLLKGYDTTATVYEKYAEAFKAGSKGFEDLIRIGKTTAGLEKVVKKLEVDLKNKCTTR